MRVSIPIFFAFLMPLLFSIQARSASFRYELDSKPHSLVDALELRTHFEERGLWSVEGQGQGALPLFEMDQIFTNSSMSRAIFVKFGLRAIGADSARVSLKDVELWHSQAPAGGAVAVAFWGFSKEEADQELAAMPKSWSTKQRSFEKSSFLWRALVPQAFAVDAPCETRRPLNGVRAVGQSVQDAMNAQILAALTNCGVRALDGLRGSVEGFGSGLRTLLTNPQAVWNSTVEKFRQVAHVVTHLSQSLSGFFTALQSLDAQAVADIACSIAGQLVPGLILAAVGVGAARVAVMIAELMPKIALVTTLVQGLARLGSLGASLRGALRTAVTGVMSGRTSERTLAIAQRLVAGGRSRAAMQVLQCGI